MKPIRIGDLVNYKKESNNVLRCGCGYYNCAVVASIDPFVLVSEEGDMLWRNVKIEDFEYVGNPSPQALRNVLDRLAQDKEKEKTP